MEILKFFCIVMMGFSHLVTADTTCFFPQTLAPLADCETLLKTIENQAVEGRGNDPKAWGRIVDNTPLSVHLPIGYRLRRISLRQEPNQCEIYVDNEVNHWSQVDTFRLQDLVRAGRAVLAQCYPRMMTGWAHPLSEGNVHVTTIFRFGQSVEGRENVTMIEVPGDGEEEVVD